MCEAMDTYDTFMTTEESELFDAAWQELERSNRTVESDLINTPAHYTQWDIQPSTYILRNKMEFWRGNIIKYASRAGAKMYPGMDACGSEITDLKKAIRYAEMRINQLQGEPIL